MIKYSPAEVRHILGLASENPRGFLSLVEKCLKTSKDPSVSVEQVKRSLNAFGVDPTKGYTINKKNAKAIRFLAHRYAKNSSNWSSRGW